MNTSPSYQVNLDVFQGPLDLLLFLIRKKKIEIQDIPIAIITREYLEYLEKKEQISLEHEAEFLLMAALLIHIKSQMLLPRETALAQETSRAGFARLSQTTSGGRRRRSDTCRLPHPSRARPATCPRRDVRTCRNRLALSQPPMRRLRRRRGTRRHKTNRRTRPRLSCRRRDRVGPCNFTTPIWWRRPRTAL